jgi:uncharacterized RDD family membrane protein YckC
MKMSGQSFAGFWSRVLAGTVDKTIWTAPVMGGLWWIGQSKTVVELAHQMAYTGTFLVVPTFILSMIYGPYCIHKWGKTVGKAILGIKIIDEHGKILNFDTAVFREMMAKLVSGGAFGLGFLAMFKHPQRQTWHDELTGTYVVNDGEANWLAGLAIVVALWVIFGYIGFTTVPQIMSLFA